MGCQESCSNADKLQREPSEAVEALDAVLALKRLQDWLAPRLRRQADAWSGLEIGDLLRLEVLQLERAEIARLPPEIAWLAALRELSLRENWLRSIPPELCDLPSLQILDLGDNLLSAVPAEIGQLALLERLCLRRNRLAALPKTLGELQGLECLDAEDNLLAALPEELCQLASLEELFLRNNQLRALPPELGQLGSLRQLDLEENRLETLPTEVGQLCKLRVLRLRRNRLRRLPPELALLLPLEVLDASCNELEALPESLNGGLPSLRAFSVAENGIAGPFNLRALFERLAADPAADLALAGNCFEPLDLEPGEDWLAGQIRQPVAFAALGMASICVASFCGAEFLDWRLHLIRTQLQSTAFWSQLCVFLPNYSTAANGERAPDWWHGKRHDCQASARYFRAADEFTDGLASPAHRRFGCCWFQEWRRNVDFALESGHRHFVVFTKIDRTVGTCQTVEWLYLLHAREHFPDMVLHCVSVSDSIQVLRKGAYTKSWEGAGEGFAVFSRPKGLPGRHSPGVHRENACRACAEQP